MQHRMENQSNICADVPGDIGKQCVNSQLRIGKYLEKFRPVNNYQNFVMCTPNRSALKHPLKIPLKITKTIRTKIFYYPIAVTFSILIIGADPTSTARF